MSDSIFKIFGGNYTKDFLSFYNYNFKTMYVCTVENFENISKFCSKNYKTTKLQNCAKILTIFH